MGELSYTQLDSELHAIHGNRDDFSQDERVIALNLAQTRIARIHDWNELWAVDTGTIGDAGDAATDKFENIPSGIRRIYSFRIVNTSDRSKSAKLRWVPQRQWDQNIPESQAWDTGQPSLYTIWKRADNFVFEFFLIPDTSYNYEVRSAKWPTNFTTSSGATASTLDRKDDMILALAASWGFLRKREMEEANRWWGIYREMANNATDQEIEEFEIDVRAPLEMARRGQDAPTVQPWADPFNRSGVA